MISAKINAYFLVVLRLLKCHYCYVLKARYNEICHGRFCLLLKFPYTYPRTTVQRKSSYLHHSLSMYMISLIKNCTCHPLTFSIQFLQTWEPIITKPEFSSCHLQKYSFFFYIFGNIECFIMSDAWAIKLFTVMDNWMKLHYSMSNTTNWSTIYQSAWMFGHKSHIPISPRTRLSPWKKQILAQSQQIVS